MGLQFTPQQKQVIELTDRNILVAAAAGSGKTAVLAERILRMISDTEKPIDIDRLLIVTFTAAAAAEMRERISAAIAKRLETEPENEHLQRQSALLHNAQITTIHSFCLFIIRNNFNEIGLDPAFRVADEGEIKLLYQDTLKELAEECFQNQEEEFLYAVECFSPSGSEKQLLDQVGRLYDFSVSFPFPKTWLLGQKEEHLSIDTPGLDDYSWMKELKSDCLKMARSCVKQMEAALAICAAADGPWMYEELLTLEHAMFLEFCRKAETGSYNDLSESIHRISFSRLSTKKDETVDPEKREAVKEIRNQCKECVSQYKEAYFYASESQLLQDQAESRRLVCVMADLALRFQERFSLRKREKNIIDFTDIEHFALMILLREEDGDFVRTKTALDYRDHFLEILIDEYQDSNLVQEYLLKSISGEEDGVFNRFMVGDVKQSIYKFRLARPELFMEKYDSYDHEGLGDKKCIDLHKNFRSRREVLEGVNHICHRMMGRDLGNVEYDKEAALYLGAEYPTVNEDYIPELLLVEKEEKDWEKKEAEAVMIACRIQELEGKFLVSDLKTGETRPAQYRDMVILLRSNAGWDEEFRKILLQYGIPVYISSKTGYFKTVEVQTILQFLRIVDNPLQDIALFGVLVSTIGGMTEEEIAWIKAENKEKKENLYDILLSFAAEETKGEDSSQKSFLCRYELVQKINRFREILNHYREIAVYTPIRQLIRDIYHDLGYLDYVSALPAGEQRKANLLMLLEKAADFEKTSYYGLFHFVRYIEQLEGYQVDYGEANVADENSDTVRIMSIHKSKGLEFSICFVAGLSKRINTSDSSTAMIMDMDYGISVSLIKPEYRTKSTTLSRNVLARKLRLDNLGEELRILYVALTRAKEKLILTASIEDFEKKKQQSNLYFGEGILPFSYLSSAGTHLDFLLPSILQDDTIFHTRLQHRSAMEMAEVIETMTKEMRREKLHHVLKEGGWHRKEISERFSYQYAYQYLEKLYTKTTVSELKKAGMEEEEAADLWKKKEERAYVPSFLGKKEKVAGNIRGNAYHKIMEQIDFVIYQQEKENGYLKRLLEQKEKDGVISKEYADCIEEDKIQAFFSTHLAQRMIHAAGHGNLRKEQPFILGIDAGLLDPEFPGQEKVLIQGIMDAFFLEDDEYVVVDYKTDLVTHPDQLRQRYQMQLEYYAMALQQLTEKKVKEKVIYSFALGLEIICG